MEDRKIVREGDTFYCDDKGVRYKCRISIDWLIEEFILIIEKPKPPVVFLGITFHCSEWKYSYGTSKGSFTSRGSRAVFDIKTVKLWFNEALKEREKKILSEQQSQKEKEQRDRLKHNKYI